MLVLLAGGGRVLLVRVGRVDDVSVARKLLLHSLEELARVVLVGDARDGGDGLATVALLETDVDLVSSLADVALDRGLVVAEGVGRRERV